MKHILFVDDEPRVLEGLQRMLRPFRHEWRMTFASGGSEALEILARGPFDVLVTDMRMPGMDGPQLLEVVRTQFPSLLRIILTGQCQHDVLLRAVSLAHRHLTKPCDPEVLKDTVTRACALQKLLSDPTLLALTSRLESVPSLPSLYLQVMKELESREPSLQKIGQIISQDIGMTAKILHVTNSAFFSLRRPISNPAQAVLFLGSETTRALVLATHVFSRLDPNLVQSLALESLWSHSMQTSALARRIALAEQADETIVGYAAMTGMLHDIGKLVLAAHRPDIYREVLTLADQGDSTVSDAERVLFGATHAEVGAHLLGLWGLPEPIVEAVAWHHRPGECPGESFSPLTAVHAGNILAHEAAESATNSVRWDDDYLARLDLGHRRKVWRTLCLSSPEQVSRV